MAIFPIKELPLSPVLNLFWHPELSIIIRITLIKQSLPEMVMIPVKIFPVLHLSW